MTPGQAHLAGLDPAWSTTLDVASHDGATHRWHLLDRPGLDPAAVTVVCLHGNPTWSVLWSRLASELRPGHRLVAPDHLGMGWSDREVGHRTYRQRVLDIVDLLDALALRDPVWLVGQDWGGAMAMGVAVERPGLVAGLFLANTGIAVPAGRKAPTLIRLAASRGLHRLATETTPLFVAGTPHLPGRRLTRDLRRALAAPYHGATRRRSVAGFVADVPFDEHHPSAADLAGVAAALGDLRCPVRLAWGALDPVFDDSFADDLSARFHDVALHRFPLAGHLLPLEESLAPLLESAIDGEPAAHDVDGPDTHDAHTVAPMWAALGCDGTDIRPAVVDLSAGTSVTRTEFEQMVATVASSLVRRGVRPGERVAVLVPPGAGLLAVVYACWRIGAVTVVADRGLGLTGLGRAVRSARVAHVVGPRQALAAARVLRWAGRARRHRVETLLCTSTDPAAPDRLAALGRTPEPAAADEAAVVFTSGATGPSKGVRYTHGQLCAQRDALRSLYGIGPDDRFVAAFAPFAVFGPALGITTSFPAMDISAPSTLTCAALEAACAEVGATMVFGSPAALTNVVATSGTTSHPALAAVRLVLCAGAPVPERAAEGIRVLCPSAEFHTPYGMTEILPVADITTAERALVGQGRGVCVGRPVQGISVDILPLPRSERVGTGGTGEIAVRAAWMSSGYDRLWHTQTEARRRTADGHTWHRTGDVGHLDSEGRLWVEGRVAHLVATSSGPVTPVPLEVACERIGGVLRAAAVGVGPLGNQQVVMVIDHGPGRSGLAPADLAARVREAVAPQPVAAVWLDHDLPVDRRHHSKIDRPLLGERVARRLAGSGR